MGGPTGLVVACDLLQVEPVEGAVILSHYDFTSLSTKSSIVSSLGGRSLDLVLSDMAPNVSGNRTQDHDMITDLVYSVLKFALLHSVKDSALLVKMSSGPRLDKLVRDLARFYREGKNLKPASSRKESSELYLLARGLKGSIRQ